MSHLRHTRAEPATRRFTGFAPMSPHVARRVKKERRVALATVARPTTPKWTILEMYRAALIGSNRAPSGLPGGGDTRGERARPAYLSAFIID